ncbi:MAG TPA: IPT/TIG domain-containing protein [Pseudonocardiaceae bacterium]
MNWTNSGTTDVTGITHLTLHLPPSLTTDGALMYMQPANYEFTEWVSPDRHELDATFVGTMTSGQSDFMKVEVDSGVATPTGNAIATVANPADTNPADNRASVPVAPPDQAGTPLPAAPPPVVTGISASTGPAAGGTSVVVRGNHLADGFVRFGTQLANTTAPSAPAPNFGCTDTQCTVTTPPEVPAPSVSALVPVTVTTPGGTSLVNPHTLFRYTGPPPAAPAPVVQFLSQSSGPAGTALVIGGTALDQGQVFFGTVPGLHSSCGPTLCTATAPTGTGQVEVTVRTEGGSSGLPFTYT